MRIRHVIFQPHRYTRTRDLAEEFATAFENADTLQLLDIYAASEEPIPGITAQALVKRIVSTGKQFEYVASFAEAASQAVSHAKNGDLVLTLGAGSVHQVGPLVLRELEKRTALHKSGDPSMSSSDEVRSPDHPIIR